MYPVCITYEMLDRWHKSYLFKVDFRKVFADEMCNNFDDHGSALERYLKKKYRRLYAKFNHQMIAYVMNDYHRYYAAMMDLAGGGSI